MALATSGGVYCDYPGDTIRKLFSPSLATTSPLAYSVLQNLTLTNDDQIFMLDLVVFHNISIDEAACLWLQNNYASWQSWIPDPSHSVSKLLILAISLPLGLFLIFGIVVVLLEVQLRYLQFLGSRSSVFCSSEAKDESFSNQQD